MSSPEVQVIGSGIAGLCCAYFLHKHGASVTLTTASHAPDAHCCSWWAGGMLAPFCEQESAEPLVGTLGARSLQFWREFDQQHPIDFHDNGTLVLAPARDASLLTTFARKTAHHQAIDCEQITKLEPDLAHFSSGIFFPQEAHINPRKALAALWDAVQNDAVKLQAEHHIDPEQTRAQYDWQIDCRGLSAQKLLPDLRGVKGEMLHIHCPDITLQRPIRLLHPRHPMYIVPRAEQQFMIGATMIEVNQSQRASVRSMLELLSAAYALNPSLAEAEIVEIGVDFRPAFDNNLPQIRRHNRRLAFNGLFRHGYLCAPAMAEKIAQFILYDTPLGEILDEHNSEW